MQGRTQKLREAMQEPGFLAEAGKHFVLMQLDCTLADRKDEYEALAIDYGVTQGDLKVVYPCIAVMDLAGNGLYNAATAYLQEHEPERISNDTTLQAMRMIHVAVLKPNCWPMCVSGRTS